jgi:hypothetical protein
MSRRAGRFFSLEEEDFAKQLREERWGEAAIEQELQNLREYKRRFRLEPLPPLDLEEAASGNAFMAAVLRKRKRSSEKKDGD